MNFEKMSAGPEMDYMIGMKIMKFTKAKFHIGGSCPKDAKVINKKEPWSARGVGGTYPYLLPCGTIFRADHAFGQQWMPSRDIAQAFEVAQATGLFKGYHLDNAKFAGVDWRVSEVLNHYRGPIVIAGTPELAICRAVLVLFEKKTIGRAKSC